MEGISGIAESTTGTATKQGAAGQASLPGRFFGVYLDRRTWGALLFMFIGLVTGVLYFTWAVTGLALSLGFMVLIIGLPFALLFLLSVRGLASVDARLVAALLGFGMHRPPATAESRSWLQSLKSLALDKYTWISLVYLVLQLPLGVIYFSLTVVLLALSLGLMATPLTYFVTEPQIMIISGQPMTVQPWVVGALVLAGFLLLTCTMHIIRALGRFHGRYAGRLLGT